MSRFHALDPASLTWGGLHTDPATEAFLHNAATGAVGVIDWSVSVRGPLLYDVASAVMYINPPALSFVDAYLATGALSRAEVRRGLDVMRQYRWAVQADYVASRLWTNDLTGIADATANELGLEHARSALVG